MTGPSWPATSWSSPTTIENIGTEAGNDMVTTRGDIATVAGEHVVTTTSLLISRGPDEDAIMTAVVALGRRRGGHRPAVRDLPVDRAGLVRYAGASGDFNVIHWNERTPGRSACPTSSPTACSPWRSGDGW